MGRWTLTLKQLFNDFSLIRTHDKAYLEELDLWNVLFVSHVYFLLLLVL